MSLGKVYKFIHAFTFTHDQHSKFNDLETVKITKTEKIQSSKTI
jgi:hypothetical protein